MYLEKYEKGIIETAYPVRQNRAVIAPTIYLPIPLNEMFREQSFIMVQLWNQLPSDIRLKRRHRGF